MNPHENYIAELEYLQFLEREESNKSNDFMSSTRRFDMDEHLQVQNQFNKLVNTKEYLTQEEFDFCFDWDKTIKEDMFYIGDYSKLGDYLNLRVYSEQEHHEYTQMVERGF